MSAEIYDPRENENTDIFVFLFNLLSMGYTEKKNIFTGERKPLKDFPFRAKSSFILPGFYQKLMLFDVLQARSQIPVVYISISEAKKKPDDNF